VGGSEKHHIIGGKGGDGTGIYVVMSSFECSQTVPFRPGKGRLNRG
jgi:hypothetical protein